MRAATAAASSPGGSGCRTHQPTRSGSGQPLGEEGHLGDVGLGEAGDLGGEGGLAADHVDADAGEVEVGVAQRERDAVLEHLGAGLPGPRATAAAVSRVRRVSPLITRIAPSARPASRRPTSTAVCRPSSVTGTSPRCEVTSPWRSRNRRWVMGCLRVGDEHAGTPPRGAASRRGTGWERVSRRSSRWRPGSPAAAAAPTASANSSKTASANAVSLMLLSISTTSTAGSRARADGVQQRRDVHAVPLAALLEVVVQAVQGQRDRLRAGRAVDVVGDVLAEPPHLVRGRQQRGDVRVVDDDVALVGVELRRDRVAGAEVEALGRAGDDDQRDPGADRGLHPLARPGRRCPCSSG